MSQVLSELMAKFGQVDEWRSVGDEEGFLLGGLRMAIAPSLSVAWVENCWAIIGRIGFDAVLRVMQ